MSTDTFFVILTFPLVDKCLTMHQYRIHNLPLLDPNILKSFYYEVSYKYLAVRSDMRHITFPDDNIFMSCIVSTGQFCRLDTALHLADKVHDCSYFLFMNNKEKIQEYCKISVINLTADHDTSLDGNYWTVTTSIPKKLYITFLTYSFPHTLKHPLTLFIYRTHVKQVPIHFSCHLYHLTCQMDLREIYNPNNTNICLVNVT